MQVRRKDEKKGKGSRGGWMKHTRIGACNDRCLSCKVNAGSDLLGGRLVVESVGLEGGVRVQEDGTEGKEVFFRRPRGKRKGGLSGPIYGSYMTITHGIV